MPTIIPIGGFLFLLLELMPEAQLSVGENPLSQVQEPVPWIPSLQWPCPLQLTVHSFWQIVPYLPILQSAQFKETLKCGRQIQAPVPLTPSIHLPFPWQLQRYWQLVPQVSCWHSVQFEVIL